MVGSISQTDFEKAAENVKALSYKPSDNELLSLYGLYKQATIGDNDTPKPGIFDFKGSAKWQAWDKNKSMNKEEAMRKYVELVKQLQERDK